MWVGEVWVGEVGWLIAKGFWSVTGLMCICATTLSLLIKYVQNLPGDVVVGGGCDVVGALWEPHKNRVVTKAIHTWPEVMAPIWCSSRPFLVPTCSSAMPPGLLGQDRLPQLPALGVPGLLLESRAGSGNGNQSPE